MYLGADRPVSLQSKSPPISRLEDFHGWVQSREQGSWYGVSHWNHMACQASMLPSFIIFQAKNHCSQFKQMDASFSTNHRDEAKNHDTFILTIKSDSHYSFLILIILLY